MTQLDRANIEASSFEQDEALVAELHRLGVRHIVRFKPERPYPPPTPTDLITSLANHPDARLHSALILLFLRQPTFSIYMPEALSQLEGFATDRLRLYYQAARYLQHELETQLRPYVEKWQALPDLFSAEFGLPAVGQVSTLEALQALGEVHQRRSGWAINWAGSYRQHIPLFLRQLRRESFGTFQP
jgi:hypothetical protein